MTSLVSLQLRNFFVRFVVELQFISFSNLCVGLFNLRGLDIDYNPVFFSYALVTLDHIHLFVSIDQLPSNYRQHFDANGVEVKLHAYESVKSTLEKFIGEGDGKTWVSSTSSYAISALVPDRLLHREISPVCSMKAIKNDVEAKGMTDCHVRDGVALCQYFAWLENAVQNGEFVDEVSGATKLQQFREYFISFSFAFIDERKLNESQYSKQKIRKIQGSKFPDNQRFRSERFDHSLPTDGRDKSPNHCR